MVSSTDDMPLVIVHRLPGFGYDYESWLANKFRYIDPLDPSISSSPESQALSRTGRVLLCVGPPEINSRTLDRFPSLECVVGSSIGLDHVDLSECRRHGIKVTNAGVAFSEVVADYAVGLLVEVLRRITASDRYVRARLWPLEGEYRLGSKLRGKRVGIVGFGSIGSMVAKRLEAFGCIIAYNSRNKKRNVSFPYYPSVKELARNSDSLILCCPLTNETHHMINEEILTELGKEGVIVNIGRGGLVNEEELVKFLASGQIGGAGLDVYEDEPNVPSELFDLDNVVLSPHCAFVTPESFEALKDVVVANLEAFFAGKPLISEVVEL